MKKQFETKAQTEAYQQGALDAYDELVDAYIEGNINDLLEIIEIKARSETKQKLAKDYIQRYSHLTP